MFRSGPVWVRVLFFAVRVVPSGPGSIFSGSVQSGFETKIRSGFSLPVRVSIFSGPVRVSFSIFVVYKQSFSLELSIGGVLELLILKNGVECSSQRLKWTSGARVMIIFGRSVARSLGRSVARSLGRSVGRSPGRSVARSLDRSIARSLDRSVARWPDRSIARSLGRWSTPVRSCPVGVLFFFRSG